MQTFFNIIELPFLVLSTVSLFMKMFYERDINSISLLTVLERHHKKNHISGFRVQVPNYKSIWQSFKVLLAEFLSVTF